MLSFKFILVLLVGSLTNVSAGKITILDDAGESADIEEIAQAVCEKLTGTSKQIAHISTIPRLAGYLRGASEPSHKHYECSQKYLTSLEDLVEIVNTANDDVCGDQKLRLIEDFHQKYVSKVRKHVKNQKRSNKVPKVVKLFFMQYVSEISTRCERSALEMLAKREHKISDEEMETMNKLRSFTDALGMSDLSKGYRGIYLLWNMVDNLPLEEDEKIAQYLEKRGSSARLNVQLNDPRSFALVQTVCSSRMKPVYSQSILPVLRLTDLGYYPQGENQLSRVFQEPNSAAHNLFLATQICETILPLRVYQDHELKPDQILALTKDEAAQLKPLEIPSKVLEEIKKVPVEPTEKVSMLELDRLPAVHLGEARERIDVIKSTVESRSNIMSRMFRTVLKNVKTNVKSSLDKYLMSRKDKHILLDEATLEKIDLNHETPGEGMRRKRSSNARWIALDIFTTICKVVALGVLQVILWALKVALLLAPSILLVIFDCLTIGSLPLMPIYNGLFYLWEIPRVI